MGDDNKIYITNSSDLPEVIITAPRKYFVGYDENVNPIYTTDRTLSQDYLQSQIPVGSAEQKRRQWAFENVGANGQTKPGIQGDAKDISRLVTAGIGSTLAPIAVAPVARAVFPAVKTLASAGRTTWNAIKPGGTIPNWLYKQMFTPQGTLTSGATELLGSTVAGEGLNEILNQKSKSGDWTEDVDHKYFHGDIGNTIGEEGRNMFLTAPLYGTYNAGKQIANGVKNLGIRFISPYVIAREINLAAKNKPKYTRVPPKNLFRTQVYKGGEIIDPYSNFVTTDPLYAANYGKVTPYIFESKSVAKAKEPMMGYKDPVSLDMFIYNNTKENPNATAIIGHDAITGEFIPSKGIEILNMDPKNLYPVRTSKSPTSLIFFERKPSNLTLAERIGIPKGDRNNLNKFLKDALEDLNQYINSGLYRLFPTINMETSEPFWGRYGNPPAIKLLIEDGVPSVRGRGKEWLWSRPNGGTYELVTDGNGNFGIGYNSYKLFDISPEFNVRLGEASAGAGINGYSKIFLTAPKNDAMHLITETPELELAKKTLIETQSPRINKNIMRDFWSGVLLSLRPGVYLSGDEGTLPKGATLIRLFKELSKKAYRRDNNGNIIGSGRTTWENIRNLLMRPEKWKRRGDGLSTDSYLALLKLANRENSPYYLRYSPDGFTTFNNQSIDNKFISDLLEKTKTGEATLLEFLETFHNWVNPYGGIDAKVVNGEITIPHPFLYKKKQGGKINNK